MTLLDQHGHRVSGANARSLDAFEQAQRELRCFIDDPVASVDRAIAESPDMPMAHVLKAWLHLLGTEPAGRAVADECNRAAAALPADERERAHLAASQAFAAGRLQEASMRLEDLSVRWPRDLLALQVGHQLDFFQGDSRMLRDRIARALPAWDHGIDGYHAVLGMHAFGLEETADYAQAELQGRRAVDLEPRDGWAWHAVAHVAEMRNAPRDGIAWLRPHRDTWSAGSFLIVHNTWHLALFELELDGHDEALRLYDDTIAGGGMPQLLDLVDASAMLWRLHLRGVDVGARWQPLAERWAQLHAEGGAGQYAFNDLHAMLAYVGVGREADQRALLDSMQAALDKDDDNAVFTRDVGLPAAQAIRAFAQGDAAQAVRLLRPVRSRAHRFGGSHAQRDLIDLTLLAAVERASDAALAAALAAERLAMRPTSAAVQRLVGRYRVPGAA